MNSSATFSGSLRGTNRLRECQAPLHARRAQPPAPALRASSVPASAARPVLVEGADLLVDPSTSAIFASKAARFVVLESAVSLAEFRCLLQELGALATQFLEVHG
jgi:hypothetical protein